MLLSRLCKPSSPSEWLLRSEANSAVMCMTRQTYADIQEVLHVHRHVVSLDLLKHLNAMQMQTNATSKQPDKKKIFQAANEDCNKMEIQYVLLTLENPRPFDTPELSQGGLARPPSDFS